MAKQKIKNKSGDKGKTNIWDKQISNVIRDIFYQYQTFFDVLKLIYRLLVEQIYQKANFFNLQYYLILQRALTEKPISFL